MNLFFFLSFLLLIVGEGFTQTIAEKKASLMESGGDLTYENEKFLQQINLELNEARHEERKLSEEVFRLYQMRVDESEYDPLLQKIRELRVYISTLQESWRELIASKNQQEGYALWYQPETTLEQLIIDYGSQDYVYIINPEISAIELSVDSNLPIPRASWNEMLELILNQNGIGIRELNPFLRELFFLKEDRSTITIITNKRKELDILSPDNRIAFVLTPEPSDVRRIWFFLDNFANQETTSVQLVGRDIILVAKVTDVRDLLRLYDFIVQNRGDKEYKAIALSKVKADEMARVLQAVFNQGQETARVYKARDNERQKEVAAGPETNGLQIHVFGNQSQGLFLIGTKEEIRHAEEIIFDIESQVGGATEKTVYWYSVKHSDATELAEVLSKVYNLMVTTGAGYGSVDYSNSYVFNGNGGGNGNGRANGNGKKENQSIEQNTYIEQQPQDPLFALPPPPPPPDLYFPQQLYPTDPYFLRPVPPVSPSFVFPANPIFFKPQIDQGNFIVDLKTGSIVMVVEAALLPKIKELIRKMDVPTKMVQLEVLLFEKRIAKQNNYGLNLLRLGSKASDVTAASLLFNEVDIAGQSTGIFDFLWSHEKKCGIPGFDLVYRFLLSQDDVTINANPSVLTVNQVPAFIAIEEEISINTGIVQIETVGGVTLKDAFQRAQYGITLKIIPTIHMADEEEGGLNTITLESDITFDTFDSVNLPADGRPNVTRRNIKNQARVADGETVIIGGLRRKNLDDHRDAIPFLGEIPGFGKLFSETNLRDNSTEMFIFITPKIVIDPACELEWIRAEELARRPGDVPEFMCALLEAQAAEKKCLFEGWLTTLFGRPMERCYTPGWHNPDTCSQSLGEYFGQ